MSIGRSTMTRGGLALTVFLLSAGRAAAQTRMADTLRKAVVEQDSKHDLKAAVADYQAVVAQFDEGRTTAATALFRLAECYREQHQNNLARPAYERVLREFPDQVKLAEQSRAVLAGTYHMSNRQVQTGPPVNPAYAAYEEAKQRYRAALLSEIELSRANSQRVAERIQLGLLGPEALDECRAQILKLQKELAAFDMGIMPAQIK